MNWQKIHNQIIERALRENRKKGNGMYYERHHIIPRCLGGTNNNENLVLLTAREHFIIHMILIELYPIGSFEWHKLVLAASSFMRKSKNHQRQLISSRQFERIKILLSESKTGIPRTEITKKKISDTKQLNPRVVTKEQRDKQSKRMLGKNNPMYGKTHSDDVKELLKRQKLGKPNPHVSESNKRRKGLATKTTKAVIQLTLNGEIVNTHISIAEAIRKTGIKMIAAVTRGKQKTAGGFIWKFVK